MTLLKFIAFLKRDFTIQSSYKIAFLLGIFSAFFPVVSFFFIGKMIGGEGASVLKQYETDFFSFALVGIAFSSYFSMAVSTFSGSVNRDQMAGCLEAILSSQTGPKAVVIMSSTYSFISSAISLLITFAIGIVFFKFDITHINVPTTLAIFAVSILTFIAIGICSAASTIIFKRGDPLMWVYGTFTGLLSGAFFPVEVFPAWLRKLSYVVPLSYSLKSLRLSILKGAGFAEVSQSLLTLSGFALVLFPLSLVAFNAAIEKGKKNGTLMQH